MYESLTNNNISTSSPSTSSPSASSRPQSPPYSKYWTRYKESCPNNINNSFYQLNMKRKALTLQYNNSNYVQLKKTKKYIIAVKNQNRITNRDSDSIQKILSKCSRDSSFSAAQSNVPGNKSFILYDNPNVPIYNYIPVKRTYQGGNNKYPYTAWQYGMLGFPRGMKGTSREMRRAAQVELSNNSTKYSRIYSKACYNTLCTNEIITEVSAHLTNNNKIENTIQLFDNNIKINIFTSNNSSKKDSANTFSNKNLYPVLLNNEYTNLGSEGQIWCSQQIHDITAENIKRPIRNTYAMTYNNIFGNDELSNSNMDLSYIYFLTVHNNEWWYSISKLTPYSISNITQYYQSELKTLAYPMYTPYPFIEFKLKQIPNSVITNNNFRFTVTEIYFQTNKVQTNININLNNVPISEKNYRFTSNRCLQNSGIKLFFTTTQDEWKKPYFYKPLYFSTDDIGHSVSNSLALTFPNAQCIGTSNLNPCMPCNNVSYNCGSQAINTTCVANASSFTNNEKCPSNGVFSALTNTFWWRSDNNRNLFYYRQSDKFIDINNNLTIEASFNYYDYCTTKTNLEFIINCRE